MMGRHNRGKSLKPSPRFGFKHGRIPMKGPRRAKKVYGRRGGVR